MSFISLVLTKIPRLGYRSLQRDKVEAGALSSWGIAPELTLFSALGLLLLALSNTAARNSASWASPIFWLSLLIIFVPVAIRLLSIQASSFERVWLVGMLGVALNLVKVLQSPIYLTYHDELLHWQTANDILRTHHLFQENSLLPVSPLYPGLELATNALNSLSGLPIFYSAIIIIAVARLVFVLALYYLYSQIGRSERVGGVAVLLYMTNPNFVFFNAQYAYESIALPFAAFVLFGIAARAWMPEKGRATLNLAVLFGLGTVIVSHHLTSYALIAFLTLWTVCAFPKSRRSENRVNPSGTALLLLIGVVGWLIFIANIVVGYLSPIFAEALGEVVKLIGGEAASRQFFKDQSGEVAPLWEQLMGLGSTGLLIMGLPFGLWLIWKRYRSSPVALALALGAAAYPASLGLRFTQAGADVSSRASGFLFVGTSFVLAIGFVHFKPAEFLVGWPSRLQRLVDILAAPLLWIFGILSRLRPWILNLWLTGLFVGAIIVGGGPAWARQPGPYLVAADMRSIEPESLSTAAWTLQNLGRGNRIVSDRINRLLNGSYGEQRPVTNLGDKLDMSRIFFNAELGNYEYDLLRRGRVDYLIVDYRLSTGLPRLGVYFEQGEPASNQHKRPIDLNALTKFDRLDKTSRIFDSGNVIIYDVKALSNDQP